MNELTTISNNLPQNFERLALNIQTNANEKLIFEVQKQLPSLNSYDSYYHYKCSLLVIFKYLNLDYKETIRGQGTKDIPDAEGMQLIYNTIKETYPKFNANDIVFAFVLAMQGKITIKDESIDLKLYGNKFNALYLINILNAYTDYRREIVFKYNDLEKNNQKLLTKTCELTEIEKENIVKEGLIKRFNEYKTTKRVFAASHLFDYLLSKQLIEFDKASSDYNEKRIKAIDIIKNDKINNNKIYDLRSFIKQLELKSEVSEVEVEIKNLYLIEFFDSILAFNESIEDYLK